jgi:hypothetical protein
VLIFDRARNYRITISFSAGAQQHGQATRTYGAVPLLGRIPDVGELSRDPSFPVERQHESGPCWAVLLFLCFLVLLLVS